MQVMEKGDFAIILVDKDLTIEDAVNELKDALQKTVDSGCHNIVLDFGNVTAINSSGIGKILLFYKRLKEFDGSIGFLNLSNTVRELFDKLMFFNLFKEYKSIEEISI